MKRSIRAGPKDLKPGKNEIMEADTKQSLAILNDGIIPTFQEAILLAVSWAQISENLMSPSDLL